MSLNYANVYNQMTWSQAKANPGFSDSIQGPDTYSLANNFNYSLTGANCVYATEGELLPLATLTIDLQAVTDFFNDPLVMTRVYCLQISSLYTNLVIKPTNSNPLLWFFGSATDQLSVFADSSFTYNSTNYGTVASGASSLDLYNPSTSVTVGYKIAIIGGTGAVPSPTATPVPTASLPPPTSTVVPATPTPTPSPSYFVTPTPTDTPAPS